MTLSSNERVGLDGTVAPARQAAAVALAALQRSGWVHLPAVPAVPAVPAAPAVPGDRPLPPEIGNAQHQFLATFAQLSHPEDTVWFLAREDYLPAPESAVAPESAAVAGAGEGGVRWDECERISRAAAETSAEVDTVTAFWREHLPIALSVRDGYAFLALHTGTGVVVYGREPEFEDVSPVAASLPQLLRDIAGGHDPQGFLGVGTASG